MPGDTIPSPGGWSRFVLAVEDLEAFVSDLTVDRVSFRHDFVQGLGGKPMLSEDPSGNLVKLL